MIATKCAKKLKNSKPNLHSNLVSRSNWLRSKLRSLICLTQSMVQVAQTLKIRSFLMKFLRRSIAQTNSWMDYRSSEMKTNMSRTILCRHVCRLMRSVIVRF